MAIDGVIIADIELLLNTTKIPEIETTHKLMHRLNSD